MYCMLKMIRKYIKKTNRADISEINIVSALNDYRNGNYSSLRQAAEAYGFKKSTLHYRLKQIESKENVDNREGMEPNREEMKQNQHSLYLIMIFLTKM